MVGLVDVKYSHLVPSIYHLFLVVQMIQIVYHICKFCSLRMKLSDEKRHSVLYKGIFRYADGAILVMFLGENSKTPNFKHFNYGKVFCHIICHPLAKICDMQEFLTLNLAPTYIAPPPSNPVQLSWRLP